MNAVDLAAMPPYSVEAEQSLIGALLLDNDAWDRIADIVSAEDLYRADHRHLFRGIATLIEGGKPADVVTLHEWCERELIAAYVGGLAYIGEIANNTPSSANIKRYAEIVRDRGIRRRAMALCHEGLAGLSAGGADAFEPLEALMEGLSEVAESGERGRSGPQPAGTFVREVMHLVEAAVDADGDGLIGVPTGLKELDRATLGANAGDMIVVAGRPSMGKTALALGIAEHVALVAKRPVAIFSMEMPGQQLVLRLVSSLSGVDGRKIRTAQMSDDDWGRFSFAASRIDQAPIEIDDTGGLTPTELRARARRLHRKYRAQGGLGMIVIDYLQLMRVARQGENRTQELSDISRGVKALAKELNIPIIALSQLNRSLEQRADKRPVMSDLRESGAIEQDADVIVMLYRDEYYNPDSPDRGIAELIIGKQRNGPTGTVRVAFNEATTHFADLTH
jgi:replicative DNA helicase